MGRGQTATLEPQAGKEYVGFNNLLDGRRDDAQLDVALCIEGVIDQRVESQTGQGHGRHRGLAAGNVVRSRLASCLGFDPGRQRVADTCHEGSHRAADHDLRIDQDQVGVEGPAVEADEIVVLVVPDRGSTRGRIVRGDRRAGDHFEPGIDGRRLGHVEDLAATDANGDVGAAVTGNLRYATTLVAGRLAFEEDVDQFDAGIS